MEQRTECRYGGTHSLYEKCGDLPPYSNDETACEYCHRPAPKHLPGCVNHPNPSYRRTF